jgi:ribosomal protein S12 methylthiotransferase
LLQTIREKIPDITLRTTLIAGHPGETQTEFEEMMDFVEKSRFDRLGVFAYSHEEGTHAFSMQDEVPEKVKQNRTQAVMELQERISLEKNQQKIGKTMKVMIDRKEGAYFIGRTEADSPEVDNEVLIPAHDQYLRMGDFAAVKVTDAEAFDLFGEVIL